MDRERTLGAVEGLFERDLNLLFQIGALAWCATDTGATARGAPKQLVEQSAEVFAQTLEHLVSKQRRRRQPSA